jgi:CDP-glycerol glycerophosphotransferase
MGKSTIQKIKEHGFVGTLKVANLLMVQKVNKRLFYYYQKQPVNNHLIVMESEGDLSDNSYALYDFMRKHGYLKKYHVIWLVNDVEQAKKRHEIFPNTEFLQKNPVHVNKKWAEGLAKCKWYIFDHGNVMAPFRKRKECIIVNLWHGCAFKRLKGSRPLIKSQPDVTFLTGKAFIPVQMDAFLCSADKLKDLGYPRNDYLFEKGNKNLNKLSDYLDVKNFKKVFLWMPTFRRSVNKELDEEYFNSETGLPIVEETAALSDLNTFLQEINCLIIFKIHHLQASLKAFTKKYSNIILLHDADISHFGLQLYQTIGLADALITDYSSVANDFMLLDRPIIYSVDDYEEYRKSRGFIPDDPIEYFAGDIVKDYPQLIDAIERIANGRDLYREKRHEILPLIQSHTDNNNCKRIVDYLGL